MRVFVLGTGRCGSSTFVKAVEQATNFTVGHEQQYWQPEKVWLHEYPDNHIEIGHTLLPVVSFLMDKYPEAKFIHLRRNKEDCLASLLKHGIGTTCFFAGWNSYNVKLHESKKVYEDWTELYYDSVTSLLTNLCFANPDRWLNVYLETVQNSWRYKWDWMGCEGNFVKSLKYWDRQYNFNGTGTENYKVIP